MVESKAKLKAVVKPDWMGSLRLKSSHLLLPKPGVFWEFAGSGEES